MSTVTDKSGFIAALTDLAETIKSDKTYQAIEDVIRDLSVYRGSLGFRITNFTVEEIDSGSEKRSFNVSVTLETVVKLTNMPARDIVARKFVQNHLKSLEIQANILEITVIEIPPPKLTGE